jgi:hypothetical protein
MSDKHRHFATNLIGFLLFGELLGVLQLYTTLEGILSTGLRQLQIRKAKAHDQMKIVRLARTILN